MASNNKKAALMLKRSVHVCMLSGLLAPTVAAQSIPDPAGMLQQRQLDEIGRQQLKQQEQQHRQAAPVLDKSALPAEQPMALTAGGPSILLHKIWFEPASVLLEDAALAPILDKFEGRQVYLADLQEVVNRINSLYISAGHYNARALLPPQNVDDGEVTVQLVEGRLGQLTLAANESTRDSFLRSRLGLNPDEVVNLSQLSKNIEWLNRTSDIQAQAQLKPGEGFGQTDLMVRVSEPPPFSVTTYVDNTGSASTGEYRGGINLTHSSLLGFRDQLMANLSGAEGELGGVVSYSLPVNRWNGRLGLSYADTEIEIIDGGFDDLSITGRSKTTNLYWAQPLYVGGGLKLDARVSYGDLESRTLLDDELLQSLDLTDINAGLGLEWIAAQQYFALHLNHNRLDSTTDKQRDSELVSGHLNYLYRFDADWSLALRGVIQHTDAELLPSARLFQIGGMASVRGYDEGVLSGNRGYFVNLEGQYRLNDWASLFAFADAGEAVNFQAERGYSASADDRISSVGLGANFQWQSLSATLAYGEALQGYQNDDLAEDADGRFHLRVLWRAW